MKRYGIGVDIGGTTCKLGLFETTGRLLEKWEIPTDTADAGAAILDDVAAEIGKKLKQNSIDKKDVQGIGIGVPGPVRADGTVNRCVNLGWGVFNVAEEMQKKTGLNVRAGNDANLAALGEMWQGGAKGHADVVMITLGTGVGGGILVDGRMVAGAAGGGGEIGHITVNEQETEICSCGKKGCLEQYASATGIVRMAKKRLQSPGETSLRAIEELTAKDIFDAAKQGDKIAGELVGTLGKMLGSTLAAVACVTNPKIILIGGGVSRAGQILLDVTEEAFKERVFHACRDVRFALAELGNDAGIYGGVRLVMESGGFHV